jgi:hypothetical protein
LESADVGALRIRQWNSHRLVRVAAAWQNFDVAPGGSGVEEIDETVADLHELLNELGAPSAVNAFYRASFEASRAAARERVGPFGKALAGQPRLFRAFLVAGAVDHLMRALNGGNRAARELLPYSDPLVLTLDRLFDLGPDGLGACEAAADVFATLGPEAGDYWRVLFQIAGDAGARQRWYGEFRDTIGRSWRLFRSAGPSSPTSDDSGATPDVDTGLV